MKPLQYTSAFAALFLLSYAAHGFADDNIIENESTPPADEKVIVDKAPSALHGKITFDTICSHCHNATYEESPVGAPGLQGVLERHDEAWINEWLQGPETFSKTNEAAKDLVSSNKFGLVMPTIPAMQNDKIRADIIAYLKTLQ